MNELVERARSGERRAFEELYRQNVGRVFALCLRMCADAARAEELTQDVFVKAWRKLDTFRGDAAFSSWIHRIAVNQVYQSERSERRRRDRLNAAGIERAVELLGRRQRPEGERVDLERAILNLPAGARSVFVLYDVEGYTHEEIGELLDIAAGTSKAQLHRARKLLREALER